MAEHRSAPRRRRGNGPDAREPQGGPQRREQEFIAERTGEMRQRDEPTLRRSVKRADATPKGETGISRPQQEAPIRPSRIREYRGRQREQRKTPKRDRSSDRDATGDADPAGALTQPPQPPTSGANNWIPIGPSVLRQGQADTRPGVSGRVRDIAVASGGNKVYVASANGGVWRSDDAGVTWRSLMDSWDLNPTHEAADSLACGAIALDPSNDQRVYVGTGEGNGIYFGVGPVVTVDGGLNWTTEPASPASITAGWPLEGTAFLSLAVDPGDPQRVIAGTRNGLYRREPAPGGGYHWDRKTFGAAPGGGQYAVHSTGAARAGMATTFYATHFRGPVYSSTDGATWAVVGTGFPASNVGRIGLAVRPTDPSVVYALLTDLIGAMLGVWRLDTLTNVWTQVTGHPAALLGTPGYYQGYWDLAIAVDPNDATRIYLGGSTVFGASNWCAALYRCAVASSGSGTSLAYSMTATMIGNGVHADVHAIVFAPGDSNKLWVGCDGGVFYSTNPASSGASFLARNTGLQTMTMNDLAQHPTEDAVLLGGTQDNGAARFTGEEAWYHAWDGDAGSCVINWNDPYRMLVQYVNNYIYRSTNGGVLGSFVNAIVPTAATEASLMYAPLVTTPRNPGAAAEAEIVAFGSVRPWISTDFGTTWSSIPNNTLAGDSLIGPIRSLAFASATRLFAGTRANPATGVGNGGVYRFDRSGTTWTATRIDNAAAGPLGLVASVTSIAVDPADATGASIYVTLGGIGDYRHVWHFNGTSWQQRSGSAGSTTSLLDVQANAIVVDPQATTNVYAGTDIGVWRSLDSGATWSEFSSGLPDAAVLDLVLHDPRRLLRASTHGRGVFEWRLGVTPPAVELYVRDTQLDQGRFTTVDWLPDPTKQGALVRHWAGPDIRLDTPDQNGTYQFPITPGTTIDFFRFADELTDDFENVATHATATIVTRAYVQVHNRGITPASNVSVMLLLANASAGLPPLPSGYTTSVQNGTPISTGTWRTVGTTKLDDVRVGFPKIAAFELPSNLLPPPANLVGNQHHCVLALVHHASDPFTSATTVTDTLSLAERKAAHKNLKVVGFTGTVPPVPPVAMPVDVHHADPERAEAMISLRIERRGYPGRIRVFLPHLRLRRGLADSISGGAIDRDDKDLRRWAAQQRRLIGRARREHSFDAAWTDERDRAISEVLAELTAVLVRDRDGATIDGILTRRGERSTVVVLIDAPTRLRTGSYPIGIRQTLGHDDHWSGGLEIRVDVMPKPVARRDPNGRPASRR